MTAATGSGGSSATIGSGTAANYSLSPDLRASMERYFADLNDRFGDSLAAFGLDRATGLRKELDKIVARYKSFYRTAEDTAFVLAGPTKEHFNLIDRKPVDFVTIGSDNPRLDMQRLQIPNYMAMTIYMFDRGFEVTGSNEKAGHNPGSPHYRGDAIDIRTRDKSRAEVNRVIINAYLHGLTVFDERVRPEHQKVWSGPHVHTEVPRPGQMNRIRLSPEFFGETPASKQQRRERSRTPPAIRLPIPSKRP